MITYILIYIGIGICLYLEGWRIKLPAKKEQPKVQDYTEPVEKKVLIKAYYRKARV